MSDHLRLVRRLSAGLFVVSLVISVFTLATFVLLAGLVLQGKIDAKFLFWLTSATNPAGFAFLAGYLVLGIGLGVLCKRKLIPMRFTGGGIWKIAWVICLGVFLHTILTPSRYVHPEGNAWVSTGRAGRWPVSEEVAKRYLWSEVEWSFLVIFGGGAVLALISKNAAQEARSLETSPAVRR